LVFLLSAKPSHFFPVDVLSITITLTRRKERLKIKRQEMQPELVSVVTALPLEEKKDGGRPGRPSEALKLALLCHTWSPKAALAGAIAIRIQVM
jgi:hypothetical protein